MTEVGIDTSVLIGLRDPRDVWHNGATALKEALQAHQANVAVFDCVLAQAIGTMARRIHDAVGLVRQRGVQCTFPKATMVPPPDEGLR
jgi:predicted nucleic acid-binding protein